MDVDELTDEPAASNVVASGDDAEIASSSNLIVHLPLEGRSSDESVASSSKQPEQSLESGEQEVDNGNMVTENVEAAVRQEADTVLETDNVLQTDTALQNEVQSPEPAGYSEEEHQNEQHIENAGIDPNYPLVLVQRVSLPSPGDNSREQALAEENNDDPIAMDQENQNAEEEDTSMEGRSVNDAMAIFNPISAAGSDNDDEDDDDFGGYVDDDMSDEDEDAAFFENPIFRGFANQFEAIRNMIAHTRRSMAEAEANFGPAPRNSLMQRFRRILFILYNRRRRLIRLGLATPDVDLPGAEPNAEIEAANDESSDNDDAEIRESPANDEPNNISVERELEMNENAVHFDTNLPAQHSYMGTNMNRVAGVNYLEAGQYIKLRLFMHQQLFFPGEVLPFMVDSSTNIIEGDADEQNGILFGVCFPYLSIKTPPDGGDPNVSANDDKDEYLYGVTCQIYELGGDSRRNTMIKSRALQRFATKASDLTGNLEFVNSHSRMKCYGYVKILPDVYMPDPLKCMNMGSFNRFRDNTSMQNSYKRFQSATTPWPAYVYEAHNISNIIDKARTQLAQHKIDTMPSEPTQLSYWLVRNLHIPEDMLKTVFLANTVNTRLKLIASTFKKENIFSCRNCAIHIADCRELFAMSKNGVQQQYCNSAGYIHKTNTLYQINRQNILYSGSPSTKFSWFPGYQWHIIVCKICKHHLGWEFKAVEPNLVPKTFFGIASSSVRVRLAEERNNVPAENSVYINFLRLMNAGMNELREAGNNIPNV